MYLCILFVYVYDNLYIYIYLNIKFYACICTYRYKYVYVYRYIMLSRYYIHIYIYIHIVFSNCLGSCWWNPRRHVLFVFSGAFSKLDEKLKEDNWLSSLGAHKKSDGHETWSFPIREDRLGPHSFLGFHVVAVGVDPKLSMGVVMQFMDGWRDHQAGRIRGDA